MITKPILFLDKHDNRPIPHVPDDLKIEFNELLSSTKNNTNLTAYEILERIYNFIDLFNEYVATFSVCQKGCNNCCRIDVQVSHLEAAYIVSKSGRSPNMGKDWTMGHRSACPFLGSDGSCSNYQLRPFNCRTFHTLDDPKYCAEPDTPHQVYGGAGYGYRVKYYKILADWIKEFETPIHPHSRDIRDWFPAKLSLADRLFGRFKR